jgi:hypothetical protein
MREVEGEWQESCKLTGGPQIAQFHQRNQTVPGCAGTSMDKPFWFNSDIVVILGDWYFLEGGGRCTGGVNREFCAILFIFVCGQQWSLNKRRLKREKRQRITQHTVSY